MNQNATNPGIKNIPVGKSFVGFCVVRQKEIKYKNTGDPYLVLVLGDRSGRLKSKIWDKPLHYAKTTKVGNIVKIKAIVQEFQDKKELKILKLRQAVDADGVDLASLLPVTTRDLDKLKRRWQQHVESIENPHLQALLSALFADQQFAKAYFIRQQENYGITTTWAECWNM